MIKIIGIILIVLGLFVELGFIVALNSQIRNKLKQIKELDELFDIHNRHLQELKDKQEILQTSLHDELEPKLKEAQIQLASRSAEKEELCRTIDEVKVRLADTFKHYRTVKVELEEAQKEALQYEGLSGRCQLLQERMRELEADEAAKKELLTAMKNEESQSHHRLEELGQKMKDVENELSHLQESFRQALGLIGGEGEEGVRHIETFHLTRSQERMLGLLDEVVELYPELREALMTVAWKKVWLPEIQRMVKALSVDGAVSGIYRLSWVNDEKVCYIGQAVKISERWYTHIKKMIGVEAKGNERLYAMVSRPDEVTWEVVEVWDGKGGDRSKWLNEREEWWIETMGAREIGWNKK